MPLKINNITASAKLETLPNLDIIYKEFGVICKYNPTNFPGLSMRIKKPKCTVLIFKSGKIVLTGLKHQFEAKTAIRLLSLILGDIKDLTFCNFVGSFDQGYRLYLPKIYNSQKDKSVYETEIFPALQIQMKECTALVYTSGKFILTGCKSKLSLYKMFILLTEKLKKYRLCL